MLSQAASSTPPSQQASEASTEDEQLGKLARGTGSWAPGQPLSQWCEAPDEGQPRTPSSTIEGVMGDRPVAWAKPPLQLPRLPYHMPSMALQPPALLRSAWPGRHGGAQAPGGRLGKPAAGEGEEWPSAPEWASILPAGLDGQAGRVLESCTTAGEKPKSSEGVAHLSPTDSASGSASDQQAVAT